MMIEKEDVVLVVCVGLLVVWLIGLITIYVQGYMSPGWSEEPVQEDGRGRSPYPGFKVEATGAYGVSGSPRLEASEKEDEVEYGCDFCKEYFENSVDSYKACACGPTVASGPTGTAYGILNYFPNYGVEEEVIEESDLGYG